VRSFSAVGTTPPFIARGRGSRLWDVEGREYVDYAGSWGPLILGHAHPRVVAAVREAADLGTSFGAPTPGEVALARRLVQALPAVEMVRLVNSGTEATMSALRLARACTGRERLVKFAGRPASTGCPWSTTRRSPVFGWGRGGSRACSSRIRT
jgi:glutamate-1-semialdehyde 2,1-aminomutase